MSNTNREQLTEMQIELIDGLRGRREHQGVRRGKSMNKERLVGVM